MWQYLSESTWSFRRSSERAPVQRCKDESHYVKNISGSDNCVAVLFIMLCTYEKGLCQSHAYLVNNNLNELGSVRNGMCVRARSMSRWV